MTIRRKWRQRWNGLLATMTFAGRWRARLLNGRQNSPFRAWSAPPSICTWKAAASWPAPPKEAPSPILPWRKPRLPADGYWLVGRIYRSADQPVKRRAVALDRLG